MGSFEFFIIIIITIIIIIIVVVVVVVVSSNQNTLVKKNSNFECAGKLISCKFKKSVLKSDQRAACQPQKKFECL